MYNFFQMRFSGVFFVVILSLTVQMNLPLQLQTGHFFVSRQMYKISKGSIIFSRKSILTAEATRTSMWST